MQAPTRIPILIRYPPSQSWPDDLPKDPQRAVVGTTFFVICQILYHIFPAFARLLLNADLQCASLTTSAEPGAFICAAILFRLEYKEAEERRTRLTVFDSLEYCSL